MRKVLIPILLLSLLALPAFAQSQNSNTCFGSAINWMLGDTSMASSSTGLISLARTPVLLYAIGFVIFLLVAAYMLGTAWQNQKMVLWAKTEWVNAAISVALIGIVISMFISSCTISQAIAGLPSNVSPAQAASTGLGNISSVFGVNFAESLLISSVQNQFQGMYYAYWTIPALNGGGISYKANERAFSTQKELLIDIYLPLLLMVDLQRIFLEVALPGIVAFVLPIALLLRMIFVTRDVGNILIALAFAIYFVMPLLYLLCFSATSAVFASMAATGASQPFVNLSVAKSNIPGIGDAFLKIGYISAFAILVPNIAIIGVVTMTMALYKALRGFGV